jgi:hypothetical protein
MSVQLIVYPQHYDGYGSVFSQTGEFCVDGSTFNALATSPYPTYTTASTSTNPILSALGVNPPNLINTWYSYRSSSNGTPTVPTVISGAVRLYSAPTLTLSGIYQRLSNLVVGMTYEMTIDLTAGSGIIITSSYDSITVIAQPWHSANQSQITHTWTAASTDDTIVITYYNTTADNIDIENVSVTQQGVTPTQTYSDLLDGQVICDLYEDEDIPLSLSVDDFKNVAEKVQSYSKAFKLPATKRNNQIFDHIFEITRTDTGLNFNPYKKTKCVLKQDGFLLFEGYLKMIDISDKSGEISYNVNLYSEAIALSDVLSLKTFSDLDFSELQHDYQKENIYRSWYDSAPYTPMTYINPNTSGFRDSYSTLKYPFIDWAHQIIRTPYNPPNSAIEGMPEVLDLQGVFRPCINVKYLLDRIFQDSPYSYQSEFFESDLFTKLYMDFSWGENISGVEETSGIYDTYLIQWCTTASFTHIQVYSDFDPQMNYLANGFTALADGQSYELSAEIQWENVAGSPDQYVETRWAKYNSSGTLIDTYDYINANVIQAYPPPRNTSASIVCNDAGDYIQLQWKASTNNWDLYLGDNDATCTISGSTGTLVMTTNTLLQTLRGELNQWEFLKGLINMFNIVTMPHPNNPEKIIFEPYYNMFLDNDDSKELNWTDKVDVAEIKLTPLTDLNKITKFRYAEDEDDYTASAVKASTGGHPYGALDYIAPSFSFDLLTGEEEISAEPFATSVPKALTNIPDVSELVTPAIYSVSDDGESQPFENSPRLFYNNGIKSVGSGSYYIPSWNSFSSANWTEFLQFSHLTDIPTGSTTIDINYETQQTLSNIGTTTANLFNLFWLPYYKELYNPDTRIMTLKVNLTPSDVNDFNFYDTVMIKNRIYRVNKIDYKPNDLAKVEFILIP